MPEDRRNPIQPFHPSLIEEFLRGRTLVEAVLMAGGKTNSNYRLQLEDGSVYVLRIRSQGDAEREAYVMDRVRDRVPVPEEMERGSNWSIYTYLDGVPLSHDPTGLGPAASVLARIHSITFPEAGWIQADGSVAPFDFGGGDDFLTSVLAKPEVRAWIGPRAVKQIPAILERESGRLRGNDGPCLVHGDYNPTNILVTDGKISGILDWEFSHSGTPYMDIGNLLRHTDPDREDEVRNGLEDGGMGVPLDWRERAWLVDVSSQLEFLTSGRSDSFKRRCVERIHAFVREFG